MKSVSGSSLKGGHTKSCGCRIARKVLDLTGQRYGNLVVLKRDETNYDDNKGIRWICKCDCGTEVSGFSSCMIQKQYIYDVVKKPMKNTVMLK